MSKLKKEAFPIGSYALYRINGNIVEVLNFYGESSVPYLVKDTKTGVSWWTFERYLIPVNKLLLILFK